MQFNYIVTGISGNDVFGQIFPANSIKHVLQNCILMLKYKAKAGWWFLGGITRMTGICYKNKENIVFTDGRLI